jgi:hypothetical protein
VSHLKDWLREHTLPCRLLLFALCVPLQLRRGIRRLQALLSAPATRRPPREESIRRIAELTDLSIRRGWPFVRPGCLTRGLTQCYFMRREGLDVSLVFGLEVGGPQNVGHCWLERDSKPFLEKQDPRQRFTTIFRIPGQLSSDATASIRFTQA